MRHVDTVLARNTRALQGCAVGAAEYAGESRTLRVLSIILVCSIAAYLYFVGISILNVISSREASLESERLRTVVANLEEEYFNLAEQVSPDRAAQIGLTESTQISYVRRAGAVAATVGNSGM